MMSNPLSSRSWLTLGSITLLQALSGTRSIFSACSSLLKQQCRISALQLNHLIVASETGRLFGCYSDAASDHLPEWMILLIGLIFGAVGYGVQYLYLADNIRSLPYWQLLLLNFLAGNSICWINTYCRLVAMRNMKNNHKTILAITSIYSGLTGKIYTSLLEGIQGRKCSQNSITYLLLNCLVPVVLGIPVAFSNCFFKHTEQAEIDKFPVVLVISMLTAVYTVFELITSPFNRMSLQLRVVIVVLVIMSPVAVALVMAAAHELTSKTRHSQVTPKPEVCVASESKSKRVKEEVEISIDEERGGNEEAGMKVEGDIKVIQVGCEHGLKELIASVDFWLFYLVNAAGATLGMVYLNNIDRMSEPSGNAGASFLLPISSIFGFLGRIFSVVFVWHTRGKPTVSKPALIVLIMIPMPAAFFLLISDSSICLYVSIGILATCSGAMSTIAGSTTSELFGPLNSAVNHTIVLTNIPLGLLVFGNLAALSYETEDGGQHRACMGLKCHLNPFIVWGFICSVGSVLSIFLHIRTRKFYSQRS